MTAVVEHGPPLPRRIAVKQLLLIIALLVPCWGAPAQTNLDAELDLSDLVGTVQEWAEENLDEDFLASLGEVDQQKVEAFLKQFAQQLDGNQVLDLAALTDVGKAALPLLEAHEETQPYAAWLRSRLDYPEAAEELRRALPPPKVEPGKSSPSPTNPPPVLERKVWEQKLSQRPLPPGAEQLGPKRNSLRCRGRSQGTDLAGGGRVSFDRRAKSPVGAAGLFNSCPRPPNALDCAAGR